MSNALILKQLAVRRMPGFPSGLPDMAFAEGVTILYGPNAAGKTTTARAVLALLWPRLTVPPTLSVRGLFQAEGAEWVLDLDAGRRVVQRDGLEAIHPNRSSEELLDRYLLGLHDLLAADDAGFAQAVLRESTGGWDLERAAADAGFQERPFRKGADYAAWEKANQNFLEARRAQADLAVREADLADLRAQRDRAEERNRRAWVYRSAARAARLALDKAAAEAALAEFPPDMDRLDGREVRRLEELDEKILLVREDRSRAAEEIARTEARLAAGELHLPGDATQRLSELKGLLAELDEMVRVHQDREREQVRLHRQAEDELHRLGLDPERLTGMDIGPDDMRRLEIFARHAERLRAEHKAWGDVQEWLGGGARPADRKPLEAGLDLLEKWLAAPLTRPATTRRIICSVAAGLLIAAGGLLGFNRAPEFYLLVAGGILFLVWALLPDPRVHVRARLADAYDGMNLPLPGNPEGSDDPEAPMFGHWTEEAVRECVADLRAALSRVLLREEKSIRWASLNDDVARRARELDILEAEKRQLAERCGTAPDLPETSLYDFLQNLQRWRNAASQERADAEERRLAEARVRRLAETINQRLADFGMGPAAGRAAVQAALEEIERRIGRRRDLSRDLDEAGRRLAEREASLAEREAEHRRLFEQAGLPEGAVAELRRRVELLDPWKASVTDHGGLAAQVAAARKELAGHEDLLDLPVVDLEAEARASEETAATLDELRETIVRIEHEIAQARRGHVLEEALIAREDAESRLREARDADADSRVGLLLKRHLEASFQNRDLPSVFNRARELFARFTKGRFELSFDPRGPAFQARDTLSGLGLKLDQLSGGTRLQLLLAVRAAFVEERESGLHLPLVLDETLANSDEERGRAVIEAAADLAAGGRQIMYLTARRAEVRMWEQVLADRPGTPLQVLDLADLRALEESDRLGPPAAATPAPPGVPAPGGLDHAAYGRTLGVPAADPRAGIGGLHLWYLIDDPDQLYNLLRLGLTRWGQLKTLVEQGGMTLTGGRGVWQKTEARARVLEYLGSLLLVGRGRPAPKRGRLQHPLPGKRRPSASFPSSCGLSGRASSGSSGVCSAVRPERRVHSRAPRRFLCAGHRGPARSLKRTFVQFIGSFQVAIRQPFPCPAWRRPPQRTREH